MPGHCGTHGQRDEQHQCCGSCDHQHDTPPTPALVDDDTESAPTPALPDHGA
ncbi:MAG: hypothetical protein KJ548_11845 [Actinobacteria bacterium]|nr:hypothetical protein [Actinomycetota bacterium]MCG2800168.1 hypothetical protein [Cellulomonas sp.]